MIELIKNFCFQRDNLIYKILKECSKEVWARQKAASESAASKVSEVTLTENLMYKIYSYVKEKKLGDRIGLYHSKDEKTNGADIEICLKVGSNQYLCLACQAKRLYMFDTTKNKTFNKPRYGALNHYVGGDKSKNQTDLLIKYAKRKKAIPLYLLYNYHKDEAYMKGLEDDAELYGCTLLSAYYVQDTLKASSKCFESAHGPAKPITSLSCLLFNSSLTELQNNWGQIDSAHRISFLTAREIERDGNWIKSIDSDEPFRFVATGGPELETVRNEDIVYPHKFSPRYRIVISPKETETDE
ncbi:DUF6615 family protein [Saprospira grandis]|nr:DUF6615 family protein [Saprospira grandis]